MKSRQFSSAEKRPIETLIDQNSDTLENDRQFMFLLEAYKAAMDYFQGFIGRVYNRFNIILTLDILLAGLFLNLLYSTPSTTNRLFLMVPLLGLTISLILYIQSAQDKYIFDQHVERINKIRELINQSIKNDSIPAPFSPMDRIDLNEKKFIFKDITAWRLNPISISRIPVVASLVLILFWVIATFLIV